MPALDFALIEQLGRDLHTTSPGVMSEDQVCPWTLFLTMALTLLKGNPSRLVLLGDVYVVRMIVRYI
jgi:hypothetical protein